MKLHGLDLFARLEFIQNFNWFAGRTQVKLRLIEDATEDNRANFEGLKLDFETVRASSKGVDRLLASIQEHIDDLTANITIVNGDVEGAKSDLNMFGTRLDQTDIALGILNTNVADNRNGLVLADDQFQMLRLNSSTLKVEIRSLSKFMGAPIKTHYNALRRCAAYVRETKDFGLTCIRS